MSPKETAEEALDKVHWAEVEEATELLQEDRFFEALQFLRDTIKKSPRNPYAFYFLGVAFYETGEIESSRDAYQAAVRLAPEYTGARLGLVHVLRKLGEHKEAVHHVTVALQQTADGDTLYAAGMAAFARSDYAGARGYFEVFLGTNPEFEVRVEVEGLLEAINREAN